MIYQDMLVSHFTQMRWQKRSEIKTDENERNLSMKTAIRKVSFCCYENFDFQYKFLNDTPNLLSINSFRKMYTQLTWGIKYENCRTDDRTAKFPNMLESDRKKPESISRTLANNLHSKKQFLHERTKVKEFQRREWHFRDFISENPFSSLYFNTRRP